MSTPPQIGPWIKYKQKAASKTTVKPASGETIPIEEQRVARSLGVNVVQGQPYENAIATVAEHEPHNIEINDPARFNLRPAQTAAHEITHLWQNQLPGKTQAQIPPDNPKAPYDLSNIDQLRKQGHTLATIPREQAATILQTYTADPSQRARLQPWINDMNTTPLSIMKPTGPNDKQINRTVRPPMAPIEAWKNIEELKAEVAKRNPRKPGGTK